ncbi:MAG: replication-relaxation family protein [Herpetosiphonaceae bacterium]|nr:replication-relaxation family protein [Herpetosiphonaceae bacterium]
MAVTQRRKFQVTKRDLDMLASIVVARYLTAEALEWLHWPTWRDRWKAAQAAGKADEYRPAPHLYRRLSHLVDAGLLYKLRRPIERSWDTFGRAPDVYMLSPDGVEMLASYHPDWTIDDIVYPTRKRERSYQNIAHGAAIGQTYAALRAAVEARSGITIEDWQGDYVTARAYDRVVVRRIGHSGNIEQVTLPVQPDATFLLCWTDKTGTEQRRRFFVELDRGTRATRTWADKISAYDAYQRSAALKARYGTADFLVLTITTTEAQRQTLMQATVGILQKADDRYFFVVEADLHPDQIGRHWHYVTGMTKSEKRLRPVVTTAELAYL